MTRIIGSLSEVSANYDALFVDLWGCLHNGIAPFPAAIAALRDFQGYVVLLTNSPRPREGVREQLNALGVPAEIYHDIASSGDAAREALKAGVIGRKVYHLGPERDLGFFEGADVERVPLEDAQGIVCTGLFDDRTETPDDYRLTIRTGVNRGLKMLCANPDIFVDVGETRIYCAGALAAAYTEAGGESLYFGKPHVPIYTLAQDRLAVLAGRVDADRILCIGDGIHTDIQGAVAEGLDSLFITGGLAADQIPIAQGQPDATALAAYCVEAQLTPTYAISHLK